MKKLWNNIKDKPVFIGLMVWSMITYLGYLTFGIQGYIFAVWFHHWFIMPMVMSGLMLIALGFNRVVMGVWGPKINQ